MNPPIRLLLSVIAYVLLALVAFAFVFSEAEALVPAEVVPLSVQINIGYDSTDLLIDSVVFRSKHRRATNTRWSWLGKGAKCVINTASDNSTFFTDSLCWDVEVPIDSFQTFNADYGYMPSVAAWIYWNTRRGVTREDIDITPVIHALYQADTLLKAVATSLDSADATFLADTIDTRLSAAHSLTSADWSATGAGASGTGAYLCTLLVIDTTGTDDTLTNTSIAVFDYSRTRKAWPGTGSSGLKAVTNLDNENLTFAVQATLYFQESGSDSVSFPAKDTNLTILVYTYSPGTLPGGDSCIVLAFTNDSDSYADVVLIEGGALQDTSGVFLSPVVAQQYADVNGVIQFTLPRTAATRQKSKWIITVTDGSGNKIGSAPQYTVPNQATDTVLVMSQ